MSNKIYVVDTNVILRNPLFINSLKDATVIIPSIVLEEVDSFKKDNELGKNARVFGNFMDKLYLDDYKIQEINVDVHISFREPDHLILKQLGKDNADNRIIECANYFHLFNNSPVELLSNDTLVRVKARGLGLSASGFTSNEASNNSDLIYQGYTQWVTYGSYIQQLYSEGFLMISNELKKNLFPHMFFEVKQENGTMTALAKVNYDCTKLELINPDLKPIWGITPRNPQQKMALHLLLNPDIQIVTLLGIAGSGKTLLSLASGLLMTAEENFYDKIIMTKPVVPMGKDIGFLPGNSEEKMNPWLRSYYDNLEVLVANKDYEQLKLEINVLTYIRGRSLPRQYIIVDEAQNLTRHEVKTIVTRAGEGTKIILMGDVDQIDAPYLDSMNNGLSYVINKFKGESISGHITLEKSERSELAAIAAKIL